MSLSSTSTIKSQLRTALGVKASGYFDVLQQFVAGKISRTEFDDSIRQYLDAPNLGMRFSRQFQVSSELITGYRSTITQLLDHLVI